MDTEKPVRMPKFRSAFHEAVWNAYVKEHGVKTQVEIARLMGIKRAALSLRFSGEMRFGPDTLQTFLSPIASPERREAIKRAFDAHAFPNPVEDRAGRPYPERVARLNHENEPERALALAWEGLDADPDARSRWTLLLLAFKLATRLDSPDETMRAAARLKAWGDAEERPELRAAAHAVVARAMRRTTQFAAKLAIEERQRSGAELARAGSLSGERLAVGDFAEGLVESENIHSALLSHEAFRNQEKVLREHLSAIARRRERAAHSKLGTFRARQLEASVYLGLGDLDLAERSLEAAIEVNGATLETRRECGHLRGRLLAERGRHEEAESELAKTAEICARDRYVYLERLARTEMARIERTRMARV